MAREQVTGENPTPARVGDNLSIHPSVLMFGAEHIEIGSNVRIDAYTVITAGPGKIVIGDNIHISAGVHIFGTAGARIDDFCSLSSRVSVFTTNDDYRDGYMSNPTIPMELRKVKMEPVVFEKHALVGCGCVVLPGVTVGEGAAVGALTVVNKSVEPHTIVAGTPMRRLGERDREKLAEMEARFRG